MKNRISPKTALKITGISIISFVLTITTGWAVDRVTFSESYVDKLACSGDSVDGFDCETLPTGKFSLKATVSYSPSNTIDVGTLNTNTAVSIVIGAWALDTAADSAGFHTLGDATTLKFKSSAHKGTNSVTATFLLIDDIAYDTDCDLQPRDVGKVTLTINETKLTVSVSANTGEDNLSCEDNLENSPIASNFDGDSSGSTTDALTVSISVGDTFSVSTDLTVHVRVSTKTAVDESTLASKISVTGTGSF